MFVQASREWNAHGGLPRGGRTLSGSYWLSLGSPTPSTIEPREKLTTHREAHHTTMASLPRRLLLQSRQCPSRIRPRAAPKHSTQWQRPISTTSRRCANEETKEGSATAAAATRPAEQLKAVASEAEPHASKELSPEEITAAQLARLVADLKALDPDVVSDAQRKGQRGIPFATEMNLEKDEDFDIEEDDKRKIAAGFWAEGEESMGPDEDYFGDDITSHGHGELAQHRELREYNRLVAWEMPLLSRTYTTSSYVPRRDANHHL
jgi:small subunit ribosomal protein S35